MIIIFIDVFFARLFDLDKNYNPTSYLIVLMILSIIFAAFSRNFKPFNDKKYKLLNDLECSSFVAQGFTCCFCCLSLSLRSESEELSTVFTQTLRQIALGIGTFINIVFIFLWIFHYWKVQIKPVIVGMLESVKKIMKKSKIFLRIPSKLLTEKIIRVSFQESSDAILINKRPTIQTSGRKDSNKPSPFENKKTQNSEHGCSQ